MGEDLAENHGFALDRDTRANRISETTTKDIDDDIQPNLQVHSRLPELYVLLESNLVFNGGQGGRKSSIRTRRDPFLGWH